MNANTECKATANAVAAAALEGITAIASRDDHGHRTIILSRGPWTREVPVSQVADALAEARSLRIAEPV